MGSEMCIRDSQFINEFCLIRLLNNEAELYPRPKQISKTFKDLSLNLFKSEGFMNLISVSFRAPSRL